MENQTTRKRSAVSAAVVAATAAALLGTALSPQGAATPATESANPGRTAAPQPSPEEKASKEAQDKGRRVEVIAQRTETSQLFADPSGTFTEERYVLPRWTEKDNTFVPIDTTLVKGADGRITTKATKAGISFSGGGTGSAVTLAHSNRSLAFSWTDSLPEPRLDGDTATYPEVLPGVDLKLRAGNSGFSQLLVVKTPQAASNPALASIRMAMSANGLSVAKDAHGNMRATDPAGQEVFTAPAPRMWDSSSAAPPAAAARAAAPKPPSEPFTPGDGAKQATMKVSFDGKAMTLAPDQSLLKGKDTTYPVYIDPEYSAHGGREEWALVYKATPNTAYFGGAGWHNPDGPVGTNLARVGYEDFTNGLARSFFRMDSNNLWNTKKLIKGSTFRIKNVWSYSCTARSVELWLTGGISSATTWANTDNSTMWARKLDTRNESHGYVGCTGSDIAFDATSAAKEAATKRWTNITLGLRATSETDVLAWKKFDIGTARLTTTYNTYPKVPETLDTTPDTWTAACQANLPSMGTPIIGNTDITLQGKFTDPDGGMVKARFVLWPYGHYDSGPKVDVRVDVVSGRNAKLVVTKEKMKELQAAAGMTGTAKFYWFARAEDGELSSPWTDSCSFDFDATRPSKAPTVSSTQFPNGTDGWPETTGLARTQGTFNVTALDAGTQPKIEYWTDWDPTVRSMTNGLAGDVTFALPLTPPSVGRHTLSVRSIDAGGNISDTTRYPFYADGTGIPDKPGDLNGDGLADFYGIRSDGDLWFYAGTGNGRHAPYAVASDQDFSGSSITRRGDWTADGYEDLVALVPTDEGKELRVYPNNGFGHACSRIGEEADGVSKACQFDMETFTTKYAANNHWKDATEIVALGDVDGPTDLNGDGKIEAGVDRPSRTDLLVKQGDQLWLYFGSGSSLLDDVKAPVLIGTGGWTGYSLAAPGDFNKDGKVDLLARHRTNGELKLYPGSDNQGGGLGAGSTSSVIGTGWTATNRPLFTAVPDANRDGTSDLWATTGGGQLYFYPNALGAGTLVGTGGWTPFQNLA